PPGDLALTGADVEHPLETVEIPLDDREDLLLVLGIDPVGEPLLPPLRVLFPGIRTTHRAAAPVSAGRSGPEPWPRPCAARLSPAPSPSSPPVSPCPPRSSASAARCRGSWRGSGRCDSREPWRR